MSRLRRRLERLGFRRVISIPLPLRCHQAFRGRGGMDYALVLGIAL